MNVLPKSLTLFSFCCLLCTMVGCGEVSMAPVTGTVTYQGKPLEGAVVSFISKAQDKQNLLAAGITDAEGKYTLKLRNNGKPLGEGALVGENTVIVLKDKMPTAPPAGNEGGGGMLNTGSIIPVKYNRSATSGLSFEVKASGSNVYDIELKDD